MKRINRIWIYLLLLMGFVLIFTNRCKKDDSNPGNLTNGKTTAVFNPGLTYGTMTDQDGNIYKTIKIGTQTWMAENLRTTIYNDEIAIPNVINDTDWCAFTTGAYCAYNNTTNVDSISTYGMLYNWNAIKTGKLAPLGWHVPGEVDWTTLTTYLGNVKAAGNKLKEIDTTHWSSPNIDANNSSGFTAVPGGIRHWSDSFRGIGKYGAWWSSDMWSTDVWIRYLDDYGLYLDAVNLQTGIRGFSVRCIKD